MTQLKKVLAFCEYTKNKEVPEIEKPLKSVDFSTLVEEWYADYLNLPEEELYKLIMAANFLDIKPLLDLCCAKAYSFIKSKSIEEIREIYEIENDFSPEEEAQIMDENKWAEKSF